MRSTSNCHYAYQRGDYVYDIHGRHVFSTERFQPIDWDDQRCMRELAECMDKYSFGQRGPMI